MDPVVLLKPLFGPCKRRGDVRFPRGHVQTLVQNGGVFAPLRNVPRRFDRNDTWIIAHISEGRERCRIHATIHAVCRVGHDPVEMSKPYCLKWAPRRQHAANHPAHLNTNPVRIRIPVASRSGRRETSTQVLDSNPFCRPAQRYLPPPCVGTVLRRKTASM